MLVSSGIQVSSPQAGGQPFSRRSMGSPSYRSTEFQARKREANHLAVEESTQVLRDEAVSSPQAGGQPFSLLCL